MKESPAAPARPRLPLAAYACAWAVLASVYAGLYAAAGVAIFMALRGAVAAVLPDALLALVSLRLAGRWPWDEQARGRILLRLAPAVLGLALCSSAIWLTLLAVDGAVAVGAVRWPPPTIIVWQTTVNLLIQVAACGIGYAWHAAHALRAAQERAARAEVLRARAELHLLRSQLHPHFVSNVLHALLGLVRREPARAEAALESLGDLLRFGQWVHQTGADFVPLSREWEFVRSYLALERVRLGDRLSASLEADSETLELPVPPFVLQPLVENAVIHGVATRAAGGRIEVSAARSNGRLRMVVVDDGPGATPSQIAASPRMGLRLLQERLTALYAGRARLQVESPEAGGLRVSLDLPEDPGLEVA